jgi:CDP-diacylglycerol pyrophosphatase
VFPPNTFAIIPTKRNDRAYLALAHHARWWSSHRRENPNPDTTVQSAKALTAHRASRQDPGAATHVHIQGMVPLAWNDPDSVLGRTTTPAV